MLRAAPTIGLLTLALLLGACQQQQQRTAELHTSSLTLSADNLAQRQMQSRRFDTADEAAILSACAGVLQDLGFNLEESSSRTGLLVASKERSALESGQVAGQVLLVALIAAMGGAANPVWERDQRIRISIATKPSGQSIVVRVNFQRLIWNNMNQLARTENINDAVIYQQFFDRLSKSVVLEANQI